MLSDWEKFDILQRFNTVYIVDYFKIEGPFLFP